MAGSPKPPVAPSEGAAQQPAAAQVVGGVATPPHNPDTNSVAAPDVIAFPLGAEVIPPVGSVEVIQATGAQFVGGYRLVEGKGISLTPYGDKGVQITSTSQGAAPGAPDNSVQFRLNATTFGGLSNWLTPNQTDAQIQSGGFLGLGTGTLPTTGTLRVPYNGGALNVPIMVALSSGGADRIFIAYGAGDAWTIGNLNDILQISALGLTVTTSLSGVITLQPQNTIAMVLTGTEIDVSVPTVVNQSQANGKTTTTEYQAHANAAPSVNTFFAIPATSGGTLDVEVTAIKSDGTVQGTFKSSQQYRSNGGVITDGTQIDVQKTFVGGPPAWTLTLDHSGSNARITFDPIADNVSIYVVAAFKQIAPIP